jgi:hypothetical protein
MFGSIGSGTLSPGADIASNDLLFQTDAADDLIIELKDDASDRVTIQNDLTQTSSGVQSQLGEIYFASNDGWLNLSRGSSNLLTFTWSGTASDTTLTGSSLGYNVIQPRARRRHGERKGRRVEYLCFRHGGWSCHLEPHRQQFDNWGCRFRSWAQLQ